ncbi:hypothetical protein CIB48_g9479 [Xylaria polymorpha]|nr:hypothetical protein CIB48_g9479 [Xylaria polymorpha]
MAQQTTEPRIAQLAKVISTSVSKLQDILVAHNAPFELPKEVSDVQDAIVDATAELPDLLFDLVNLLFLSGAVSLPFLIFTRQSFYSSDELTSETPSIQTWFVCKPSLASRSRA